LTVAQVKPGEAPAPRAGAQALSLLSVPLNAAVLRALSEEPKALFDLRREIDSPPQTTMRAYMRELIRLGVVNRQRRNDFPGNVEYELAEGGRELLVVVELVENWLQASPEAPRELGSGAARSALKALVEGWSTGMIWALASRPRSLTELDGIIPSVSYPSLERRLGAMRHEGLVEPLPSEGRGTPYGVTDWTRRAVAPLVAAARWEQRRVAEEAAAVVQHDAEAALLLAMPLLRMSSRLSGRCRLAVQVGDDGKGALAGVVALVQAGRVQDCDTQLEAAVGSWTVGRSEAWYAAVVDGDPGGMTFGGEPGLAKETVAGLHRVLFGSNHRE
jgi:DNA-binding HxlR family transcriptional regulator